MKTLTLLLSVLACVQAFAGGVESKPGWIAISMVEDIMLQNQPVPYPTFPGTSGLEFSKNPFATEVELSVDNVLLKAHLIEELEGGVESILSNPAQFSSADFKAQSTKLPESITSIKYISESPESVYVQINNSEKILEIKDSELNKSKLLWEQIGAAAQTTKWIYPN